MKTFQKIMTMCCLAMFVASFAACGGGPGEVKKTDEADRTLPPAATGNTDTDDPNSGISASFE